MYMHLRRASYTLALGCLAMISACGGDDVPPVLATDVPTMRAIALEHFDRRHMKSLLVQVRIDGEPVMTLAAGEASDGTPATDKGHVRNGAVAIAYVAAIMLKLNQAGVIDIDQPIARWLPDLPYADQATPRMLANMTAGYPDYVVDDRFVDAFIEDPYQHWSNEARVEISLTASRLFEPGTNWDYSHSGYVILGLVLEAATGKSLHELMDEYILIPLQLEQTYSIDTADIPAPAIHGYTAERGEYEDATQWNPSWTLPLGAVQVSTLDDIASSFDTLVGTPDFLGADLYAQMLDRSLIGFGHPLPGCRSCHTMGPDFTYGLGVIQSRNWVAQTPLFGGYAGSVATLPTSRSADGHRVTVATFATFKEAAYSDWTASLPNWADELTRELATRLVPDNPPAPFPEPR